ncbi:N-acetyltransferase family protein [Sphingomonas sp. ID0503]|uniref:GNAT family N-acetyltransferase n=1 Tax=Sphingomonas sp. ID0503 TaxID=3399691 RepID=UPI003AFAE2C6
MIEYRDATPADAVPLDAMAVASWMPTFGWSYEADDLNAYLAEAYGPTGELTRHLADPAHRFRVATEGETIVGYAKLSPIWLPGIDPACAAQLSQLYVAYSHHGTGIAGVLFDWTVENARAGGATALYLTVWENNPRAKRFYEKAGFVHVGDYDFPVGKKIDRDLIMRLEL